MKISIASKELTAVLSELYSERETEQIGKIFWEDLFHYRGGIDRSLHTKEVAVFREALLNLKSGMPIQYVTGISFFYNLQFEVDQSVLIPRPETEELVYKVLQDGLNNDRVLDIGTGSGCISITLKSKCGDCEVVALDLSEKALEVARRNAEKHECKIEFIKVDFLDDGQWDSLGQFDVIVSNPPYISRGERMVMSDSTLKFEPHVALFPDGDDALVFYRRISTFAKDHLIENGRIYLECNEFNANEVLSLFLNRGELEASLVKDMQGKDRIVVVKKLLK